METSQELTDRASKVIGLSCQSLLSGMDNKEIHIITGFEIVECNGENQIMFELDNDPVLHIFEDYIFIKELKKWQYPKMKKF